MAQKDSRRLKIVMSYLYPDLENSGVGDYSLQNDTNGTRTFVVWHNNDIPEPTEQEIADAKEPALNAWWWKVLRVIRDNLLVESDWSQGADVPDDLKASYVTYRNDLRDLPDNVTKPDFDTLNNQSIREWGISSLMPTKP